MLQIKNTLGGGKRVVVSNGNKGEEYALNSDINPYNFIKMGGTFNGRGNTIDVFDTSYTAQGISGISLGGDKILFIHYRASSNYYVPFVTIANITDTSISILCDIALDGTSSTIAVSYCEKLDAQRVLCCYKMGSSMRARVVVLNENMDSVSVSSSYGDAGSGNGKGIARVSEDTFVSVFNDSYFYYKTFSVNSDNTITSDSSSYFFMQKYLQLGRILPNGSEPFLVYYSTSSYAIFYCRLKFNDRKLSINGSSIQISNEAYSGDACMLGDNIFVAYSNSAGEGAAIYGMVISKEGAVLTPAISLTSIYASNVILYPYSNNGILAFYGYANHKLARYSPITIDNSFNISTGNYVEISSNNYSGANLSSSDIIYGDGFVVFPTTNNASYYYLKLTRFNCVKGLELATNGESIGLLTTKATRTQKGEYWYY